LVGRRIRTDCPAFYHLVFIRCSLHFFPLVDASTDAASMLFSGLLRSAPLLGPGMSWHLELSGVSAWAILMKFLAYARRSVKEISYAGSIAWQFSRISVFNCCLAPIPRPITFAGQVTA